MEKRGHVVRDQMISSKKRNTPWSALSTPYSVDDKDPMHPYFSNEEFKSRHAMARRLMEENEIDALIVTEDNYTYFTGATSLIPWASYTRPVVCIISRDKDPVVISNEALKESTEMLSFVREIRTYTASSGLPRGLLSKTLKELGLGNGKIGAELGYEQRLGLTYDDFVTCMHELPGAKFLDASMVLWKLRMKKSSEEIALIRQACEITGKAREICFERIRIGMNERDVGRIFKQAMIELGADSIAFVMVNSLVPFELDRPLTPDRVLYLDGGARLDGYCCDFSRLATVGKSSREQREKFEVLVRANQSMSDILRPGVRCSDVFGAYSKDLKDAGLPVSTIGRAGHGQGILVTEPPSISSTDNTVLEPGFVVSTEPSLSSSNGLYIIEDVHAITNSGKETLTKEPLFLNECAI